VNQPAATHSGAKTDKTLGPFLHTEIKLPHSKELVSTIYGQLLRGTNKLVVSCESGLKSVGEIFCSGQ
jgi:hypothetical protein